MTYKVTTDGSRRGDMLCSFVNLVPSYGSNSSTALWMPWERKRLRDDTPTENRCCLAVRRWIDKG
ncbi:hypothetical protein DPMN_026032 [Dreissena polymorpha]|uniref:Uncharacterized protein n=2 Tax=Dreissena polymorpha TaxID=45954 RepID=A0A9D4RE67_DREPO|nr:hypothetical protein DPMN_026032 [Dreissena polymorpha]